MKNDENQIDKLIKTADKSLDVADKAMKFVDSIIGGGLRELGDSFHDWATYFRYKNILSIRDKVDAIVRERGAQDKATQIPPRLAIPLINEASLEDSEQVQTLWAKLISNSTNASSAIDVHPAFIDVLKQLMPDEAIILQHLLKVDSYPIISESLRHYNSRFDFYSQQTMRYEKLKENFVTLCGDLHLLEKQKTRAYLDNLMRLQILEFNIEERISLKDSPFNTETVTDSIELEHNARESLMLTDFGNQFIEACVK